MRTIIWLTTALLPLATGIACNQAPTATEDPIEARQIPESVRADAFSAAEGNNRFALDLFQAIREKEDGNLFVSPFSISTAFAMVYAGARGETQAQMADVFHFTMDQERMHPAFGALLRSLDTGASFDGYRLNIANRLWGDDGFALLPAYVDLTREHYGADLRQLDFGQPEAARGTINDWVAEKTEGKIENLIPPGMINAYTKLVLTNAIYFKGRWLSRFDSDLTQDRPFRLDATNTVSVPTMTQDGKFLLGGADGVQVLDLPYETEDLSMIFLLPTAVDGLGALEDRLTLENLRDWMDSVHETEADLFIPRFQVESKVTLKSVLADMGMPLAFSESADFSGIDGKRDLLIQDAVHKGYVLVNEEGTEAAAATAVGVGTTSVPPAFRADHPFLILIWDRVTESILFLGRVADPSA